MVFTDTNSQRLGRRRIPVWGTEASRVASPLSGHSGFAAAGHAPGDAQPAAESSRRSTPCVTAAAEANGL